MTILEIIDLVQRKINSLIFRVLLIVYSSIILTTHTNLFEIHIYLIGLFIYVGLYIYLLNNRILRLTNDFAFMIFILIGKNPNEVFLFVFILLPIINSINFSGNKKSLIQYPLTLGSYIFLNYYYLQKVEFAILIDCILPICSILFLGIIEFYTSLRLRIRNFRETLNEVVDSFYTEEKYSNKTYKIYSKIINTINSLIGRDLIFELYCLTVTSGTEEKLSFINGTSFVWSFSIDESEFIDKIHKRNYNLNSKLSINGDKKPYNLVLKVEIKNTKYIFLFITNKSIPKYYIIIGFFRTLIPPLTKIAKILLSEKRLHDMRVKELEKISYRSQYVTKATKTMHFIRNRLGPVNNLIIMLEKKNRINSKYRADFEKELKKERDRAKIDLATILKRANYLLEKSNNPFEFSHKTKDITLEKLYQVINRILKVYFQSDAWIEVSINNKQIDSKYVRIDVESMELLLSDWLSNIKKYYAGKLKVLFDINEKSVEIIILNNYKEDNSVIDFLISDLMSKENNEIMKRTTHGLYHIKTTLDAMNIDYAFERIKISDIDFLKMVITFKFINHENSNI